MKIFKSTLAVISKEELTRLYLEENLSAQQIGKLVGKPKGTIYKLMDYHGIKRRQCNAAANIRREQLNAERVDENFFFEDSSDLYYIIGLLASDGCITDRKKIQLGMQDIDVLEYYKNAINFVGDIKHKYQTTGGEIYVMTFGNKKIASRLEYFGLTPRKSTTYIPTNIPRKYMGDFIRGYFDGDGSVYKQSRKTVDGKDSKLIRVSIVSASAECLVKIKSALLEHANIEVKIHDSIKSSGVYRIQFSSHTDLDKFIRYIYGDDLSKFGMTRKKEKFIEYINKRGV